MSFKLQVERRAGPDFQQPHLTQAYASFCKSHACMVWPFNTCGQYNRWTVALVAVKLCFSPNGLNWLAVFSVQIHEKYFIPIDVMLLEIRQGGGGGGDVAIAEILLSKVDLPRPQIGSWAAVIWRLNHLSDSTKNGRFIVVKSHYVPDVEIYISTFQYIPLGDWQYPPFWPTKNQSQDTISTNSTHDHEVSTDFMYRRHP